MNNDMERLDDGSLQIVIRSLTIRLLPDRTLTIKQGSNTIIIPSTDNAAVYNALYRLWTAE